MRAGGARPPSANAHRTDAQAAVRTVRRRVQRDLRCKNMRRIYILSKGRQGTGKGVNVACTRPLDLALQKASMNTRNRQKDRKERCQKMRLNRHRRMSAITTP